MELEVLIILLVIGSTSLLLLILAACYLIRKLIKSRGKNSQDVEKVKTSKKNNSDIESKEKLIGSNIKSHILNEYSPNNKRKFLSVSLSEIPFIDEVYQSVTDLRSSKTCDAIVYSSN